MLAISDKLEDNYLISYSPTTVTIISLSLSTTSKLATIISCQVPKSSLPSFIGIV